jgi:hypothetical protein
MLLNEAQANQNPPKSPFNKGGLEASAHIYGAESFIPPFSKGGAGGILMGVISLPFKKNFCNWFYSCFLPKAERCWLNPDAASFSYCFRQL